MAASLRPTPKVASGFMWATVITFGLNSITPEMLAGLGSKWGPLVSAGIAIASYAVGAYLKADTPAAPAPDAPAPDPSTVVDELAKRLATPTAN